MTSLHKGLTPERWARFSLMEQLANVGMDVERTISWKKKGDLEYSRKAFERALDLLYLTIADPKNKKRLYEILRMKETLLDHFLSNNEYATTDESWQQYFYGFNYAAAIARGR